MLVTLPYFERVIRSTFTGVASAFSPCFAKARSSRPWMKLPTPATRLRMAAHQQMPRRVILPKIIDSPRCFVGGIVAAAALAVGDGVHANRRRVAPAACATGRGQVTD